MKTLALYNLKGGVGKTAAAVNLAYLAARNGYRTLLWDLDPQAAATYYYRIEPKIKGGASKLINKRKRVLHAIKGTDYERLDLLPSDFSFRNLDLGLTESRDAPHRLKRLLGVLHEQYDYLLMDCPPSISLLAENVFYTADILLMPLIPTHLSLRAYDQVVRFLGTRDEPTAKVRPFFSMVDRRKKLHRDVITDFVSDHPEIVRTYIPYASQVEQMGIHRAPIGHFSPSSGPARAFEALWRDVMEA